MDVSIIIVNYNVRDFLESALHSVQKSMHGLSAEVIVVDNASSDGSGQMVRSRFPSVRLIASPVNLGFGAANNRAMAESNGKYILLLNPDTIIQEDTLQQMLAFMNEHPDAGMAGCKVLNADGSFQLSCRRGFPTPWASFCKVFGLSALFPRSKVFAGYNLTYLDENRTYPVDALAGSFMMVKREVYEKIGGFDEDYFMYGEDLDWCYRTQKSGWKVYYAPVTQIIHYKGESTKRSTLDEVRLFYQAMHIFIRKNLAAPGILILVLRCGIGLRSFIATVVKHRKSLVFALADALFVVCSILVATKNRFGGYFGLPRYAYPVAILLPVAVVLAVLWSLGVYGRQWRSLRRTLAAVGVSFFVISSLTFFFKQYAFSRQIVLEMTVINGVLLSGFRALLLTRESVKRTSGKVRKAVIVGAPDRSLPLLKKLHTSARIGFDIVGFIDLTLENVGKEFENVKVVGSTQTIVKVIEETGTSDVIFVADAISYKEMLSVMNRCSGEPVSFRLVPADAEILVAKAGIDPLDELPLVAFGYNIHKPMNRVIKRMFDIAAAGVGLLIVSLFGVFSRRLRKQRWALLRILQGSLSFVGPRASTETSGGLFGKGGLVSVEELFSQSAMTQSQMEYYNLYYARNQSLYLDLRILWTALRNTVTHSPHA